MKMRRAIPILVALLASAVSVRASSNFEGRSL